MEIKNSDYLQKNIFKLLCQNYSSLFGVLYPFLWDMLMELVWILVHRLFSFLTQCLLPDFDEYLFIIYVM
jgi:hypothetical protein